MSYLDAEMSPAAVPAVLAYKAGDLIANLVSVVDELPPGRDLSTSSLELVLKRYVLQFTAVAWSADMIEDTTCYKTRTIFAH